MRDRFTRVLKGHIAVARATFPVGTTGAQLDSFARRALWAAGLDFDHGTGHGVGVYLSVHEGPQRIAKTGTVPLEPGMIVSNEPGYYAVGRFGIRIENLVVVEPRKIAGGEREMLGFRTLSFGADRHARGRSATSRACGKRLAQRLSQPRAPGACPSARSLDAGVAGKSDAQNLNVENQYAELRLRSRICATRPAVDESSAAASAPGLTTIGARRDASSLPSSTPH